MNCTSSLTRFRTSPPHPLTNSFYTNRQLNVCSVGGARHEAEIAEKETEEKLEKGVRLSK